MNYVTQELKAFYNHAWTEFGDSCNHLSEGYKTLLESS